MLSLTQSKFNLQKSAVTYPFGWMQWGKAFIFLLQELHQVVCGEVPEPGAATFYVLVGRALQKWLVQGHTEKVCDEASLELS